MPPLPPSDPPRQHFDLDGLRLAFTDEGEGPAVLALHGLPGSVRDWRWLAPVLVEGGLRVVRLDLPGFGESAAALAPARVPALAAVALRAATALGLERPWILGHSFGGAFAVEAARQGGDRVGGLALLASVGLRPHRGYRQLPAPALLASVARLPALGTLLGAALRAAMVRGGFPRSVTTADAERCLQILGGFDFDDHRGNVAALRVPTLVAWSADDPVVEAEVGDALALACPPGPRLRFDEGGHNVQKSHAGEVGAALLEAAAEAAAEAAGAGERGPG
ncbi:alpha/beta hydrolase [Myxococcota bacterium]|nr:alpha/beta hydrolase [Myxococcota bacterium]